MIGKSPRIVWIDCAKAIGMFFIVLGHTFPTRFNPLIYSFSVPLFFFISGYLCPLSRVKYKTAWNKVLVGLIIPFLALWCFNLVINAIRDPSILTLTHFIDALLGYHSALGTLWFVYNLIIIKFLLLISTNLIRWLLFALCLIATILLDYYEYYRGMAIVTIWGCYIFLFLGNLFKSFQNNIPYINKRNRLIVAIIALIVVFLVANETLLMFIGDYNHNVFLSIFLAILGILSISFFSSLFSSTPHELYIISSGSMIILAEHCSILNILNPTSYFTKLIYCIGIMFFFVGVIPLLIRTFPFLVGKPKNESYAPYYSNHIDKR